MNRDYALENIELRNKLEKYEKWLTIYGVILFFPLSLLGAKIINIFLDLFTSYEKNPFIYSFLYGFVTLGVLLADYFVHRAITRDRNK